MRIMHECCCGLDVHKKMILACLLRQGSEKQIRQFGTTTGELQTMKEWLVQSGCTHVAMESTGVYWKPVYNILEGSLELLVVNAQHMRTVPGTQDRRSGCRVDCGFVAAWSVEGQFCTASF